MKKSKLVRSTSLTMSVLTVALTFFSTFVMPAGAANSLQHIEEIKDTKQASGSAYKIVEIAPTTDSGNMGYFVDGQEPGNISGWSTRIASIRNANERQKYVKNILDSLKNTGLMSESADAAPLHLLGNYAEHYAWDTNAATYIGDKATIPASKLTLSQTETFFARGKVQLMPNETGGDYQLSYDYSLTEGGNLFVYSKWRASNSAKLSGNSTSGDTITFDDENESFTVTSDSVGGGDGTSHDIYTAHSMSNGYYYIDVKPNTKYTVSYDVETTGGNSQFFIFAADSSKSYGSSNYVISSNNGKFHYINNKTGHYEYTFYTGTSTQYISMRFGTRAANSTAKFSNISLYKITDENLFNYGEWYNSSSKEVVSGIGTASYDVNNGSVTVASTTLAAATRHEATNGYYTIPVEPNTTYNFSYVNAISTGTSSSFAIYVSGEAKNTAAASGDFIKSSTNANLSGVTYRIYSHTAGYHTVTLTTGADAKYITLGFGTMTINTTATIGNIWVTKAQQGFDAAAWLNSVTTSDNVTKTSNSVSLTSTALTAASTSSTYVTSSFEKNATYTFRFKVAFDNEKTTNNWRQGYAFIYVNGQAQVSKYFTSDGVYELSIDTATWMTSMKFDIHISSPNTSFTVSDINVTCSIASDDDEEGPEFVQNIQYFEYGKAETEYGVNLFSFSKWAENSYSKQLCNATSKDTMTPDYGTQSIRVVDDGEGITRSNGTISYDTFTAYSGSGDYYNVNVEPNTTYRLSYDLTTNDGGQGQFFIFPCGEGFVRYDNNSGPTVTPEGGTPYWHIGIYGSTGSYNRVFTTSSDTLYLQIRVGFTTKNSDVTFSNISIQKIENPVNYYYNVTPTEYSYYMKDSSGKRILPDDGTVLYTLNNDGRYEYYGTYYSDGSGVKIFTDVHYYSLEISDDCWPTDEFSESQPYRAVSDSFRKAEDIYDETGAKVVGKEKAYFTRAYGTLTYVGNKEGNANIDLTGTDTLTIQSNIVYYTGGFENNNWFKRRVLEIDGTETKEVEDEDGNKTIVPKYDFPITVTTITPDNENLEVALRTADLIVITGGIDVLDKKEAHYKTTIKDVDGTTTTQVKDIPDETIDSIISTVGNYVSNKMPIIIDTALYSSSDTPDNLLKLCQSVSTDRTGKVDGSIYTFNAVQIGVSTLVNSKIYNAFPEDLYSKDKPYNAVYTEIDNENQYRGRKQLTTLTGDSAKVNEATVMRYIINYKNQRFYRNINTLKVLDIEPISTKPTITEEMIKKMLPSGTTIEGINIVTMSVAEFVGKNENFDEEYDLVYIGASPENLNTIKSKDYSFSYRYKTTDSDGNVTYETATGTLEDETYKTRAARGLTNRLDIGSPIYNDTSLNGYYYSNVGDTITTRTSSTVNVETGIAYPDLSGLLAEDYVNIGDALDDTALSGIDKVGSIDLYAHYWVKGGHATFRTTGADLNQAAYDRLQAFIDSGRPVIVSDKLVTRVTASEYTATASVRVGHEGDTYTVNLDCSIDQDVPEGALVTYQWYKDGNPFEDPSTSGTKSFSRKGSASYDQNNNYVYNLNALGEYYCEVTISYNSENVTVNSNKCYVKSKGAVYNCYIRATPTGTTSGWGLGSRDNYNYYIDFEDGLPEYITKVGYKWEWTIWGGGGKKSGGSADNFTTQAKQVHLTMTFYYKNEEGNEVGETFQVMKDGGSQTTTINTRVDGDNDTSQHNSAGNLYKWWDMSSADHKRHDGNPTYNNWTDGAKKSEDGTPKIHVAFPYVFDAVYTEIEDEKDSSSIPGNIEINTGAIDNCSYMYRLLVSNFYRDRTLENGADNVFSYSEGTDDTKKLKNSLAIAKPEIEFIAKPAEYPAQLSGSTLDFTYVIRDQSNPRSEDEATYTTRLYIDTNSDGKFSSYEINNGVTYSEAKISKDNTRYNYLSLSTGTQQGLIAWKLEVYENMKGAESPYQGTASYTGYSFIKPTGDEKIKINALMVLPGSWTDTYKSLEECVKEGYQLTVNTSSGGTDTMTFKKAALKFFGANEYIGNVFESKVFDELDGLRRLTNEELGVNDEGIGIDGLYHMGFDIYDGDITINIAVTNVHDLNLKYKADASSTFLDGYSMLIMGFGDEWGRTTSSWNDLADNTIPEGFEIETAEAVCNYINKGGPTLFCHDTLNKNVNFVDLIWDDILKGLTNVAGGLTVVYNWAVNLINKVFGTNIDTANRTTDQYKNSKIKMGYWNNLIMRDTLGLDRYGITYAIKKRAAAIKRGDDKDSHNTNYAGEDKYSNAVLGRAHMYNTIYDYPYDDSLSVENMLEKDFSIAYVPGSVETYERAPNTQDSTIYVEDREMRSDEEVIQVFGEGSDNAVKLVAKKTTTKSEQHIKDTKNLPVIYGTQGQKITDYQIRNGKVMTTAFLNIGIKQIDGMKLDGDLLVDSNGKPVYHVTSKYTDYAYLGNVYKKTATEDIDKYTGKITTTYKIEKADKVTLADGRQVYVVYAGTPVTDKNGNIVAEYDKYTQGYTDYVLQRYMDDTESENKLSIRPIWEENDYGQIITTDKITQVNKGKITIYPYYINNDAMFDINGKTTEQTMAAMNQEYDIALTHEQVYQCNMNGDDITVWYALSGGEYYDSKTNTGVRNDCANAYYLYSRDNLVYTGAGHTNTFTEMEAKIFINTLVGSYTAPYTDPKFAFRNKSNTSNSKYALILPSVNESDEVELKASDYIYFVYQDDNVGNTTYSVDFYYYDENNVKHILGDNTQLYEEVFDDKGKVKTEKTTINGKEVDIPVIEEVPYSSVNIKNLQNTRMFAFAVPDEIVQMFRDNPNMTTLTLYAEPKTTIAKQSMVTKDDDVQDVIVPEYRYGETQKIEIRVLHLSDLS